MCMPGSLASRRSAYNYDGGRIIHECVVPASRTVICQTTPYDIDVREFLGTNHNEVIQKTIRTKLKDFCQKHYGSHTLKDGRTLSATELLTSREVGSFDFRAKVVAAFVRSIITYEPSPSIKATIKGHRKTRLRDPWLFPDELLVCRRGDCEDISLLIASLLTGLGVSSYNVRVCLGKVVQRLRNGKDILHDHVWVVYKCEAGTWTLIEPLLCVKNRTAKRRGRPTVSLEATSIDYEPAFTFNDEHLWAQQHTQSDTEFQDELDRLRQEWSGIDPGFAGTVHQSLLGTALTPTTDAQALRDIHDDLVNRFMLGDVHVPFFGKITLPVAVDQVDNFIFGDPYDPVDHFDSGCITEGWTCVNSRIRDAKAANDKGDTQGYHDKLKFIFHAVADFYAHSSYMHFYALDKGLKDPTQIPDIWDHTSNSDQYASANYETGDFQLGPDGLGVYEEYIRDNKQIVIAGLRGHIISGRYGLPGDSDVTDIFEHLMYNPVLSVLYPTSKKNVKKMLTLHHNVGVLPHHDKIAVDKAKKDGGNNSLYKGSFDDQFNWRKNAAIRHIQSILIGEFGFKITDFATPYVAADQNGKLKAGILKR